MKFNLNHKLDILLSYGFLKVKPATLKLDDQTVWSTITNYEHFTYLSELKDEVYALELRGGRRGQVFFLFTVKEKNGDVIFVIDSSQPDGEGSYGILPSILLDLCLNKVIIP